MTDDEIGDRLLEMREATARRCVEIVLDEHRPIELWRVQAIAAAIKKEFGLEE